MFWSEILLTGEEVKNRIVICENTDWNFRSNDNRFIFRKSKTFSTKLSIVFRLSSFCSWVTKVRGLYDTFCILLPVFG